MKLDAGALQIARRLRANGHRALLAGGCVRDVLLERPPQDWDLATDAAPAQVMELFPRTVAVGARFGIVKVRHAGAEYEVAQFRRDLSYADGRHPLAVVPADARTDALRRDFTVNAMFIDPETGAVLDYVDGQQDLQRRLIRAVGDPERRFAEDHLRMLRAIRFAAALDFEVEERTRAAITAHAACIRAISAERVAAELTAILTGARAGSALRLLEGTGLLEHVLPEVAATRGVAQPPEYHPEGDVWTHTWLTVDRLRAPSPVVAWAALLHDVGKPLTQSQAERIRFHGHEAVGAEVARRAVQRLRLSRDDASAIVGLVAEHMRLRHARQMRPGKLRRLLVGPRGADLLELHRADCLASHGDLSLYCFCRQELAAATAAVPRPQRLLTGDDLQDMGFRPGPAFGEILAAIEEEQLAGGIADRAGAAAFVAARFGARRAGAPQPVAGAPPAAAAGRAATDSPDGASAGATADG